MPVHELVEALNRYQPGMIIAYASALQVLAGEKRAGRLKIAPAALFSTAETLTLVERARVEAAFDCPIYEGYSASEAAGMAFDCEVKQLHVNIDWYILEPVDREYQPVPLGSPSHSVLVTNLSNYVQPIIRYDLGDSVTMSGKACICGSQFPTIRVEGRTNDVLSFLRSDGTSAPLFPLGLAAVIEEVPGVYQFQAIQTGAAELTLKVRSVPGADAGAIWDAVEAVVCAYLTRLGLPKVAIKRSPEMPAANAATGKFR
jgi:phenylacetate-coenzyme A ligase PaaK-like adenylate-forming protein